MRSVGECSQSDLSYLSPVLDPRLDDLVTTTRSVLNGVPEVSASCVPTRGWVHRERVDNQFV